MGTFTDMNGLAHLSQSYCFRLYAPPKSVLIHLRPSHGYDWAISDLSEPSMPSGLSCAGYLHIAKPLLLIYFIQYYSGALVLLLLRLRRFFCLNFFF